MSNLFFDEKLRADVCSIPGKLSTCDELFKTQVVDQRKFIGSPIFTLQNMHAYLLQVGMRLRIMWFHADMRTCVSAYIFQYAEIRILIYAVYADMCICACLYQTTYVSAYTNKPKYFYFKSLIVQTVGVHLFEVTV